MRIGISVTSAYATSDVREGARWMIERARAAEAAGLDHLFVGDHHAVPIPYYQNSVILGRMLAEWGDRPCGALYLLPLWHPVLLAEQVGTLASIASGRFILQCAIGPADAQFPAFGIDARERPSRFEEGLALMRRLWAGEEVSGGKRFPLGPARISPCPPEPVEVWIGATAPPAIDRAARMGDGWLASPDLTLEDAERQLDLYRERCAHHGREPGPCVIRRDFHVAEDADAAARFRERVERTGHRGFAPGALLIGDAEGAAEQVRALEALGFTDVVTRCITADQAEALGAIERLADVRGHLGLG